MSSTEVALIITVAGFFMSVGVSTFVAGMRVGQATKDIEYIRRDLSLMMSLFELVPKHSESKGVIH